MLYNFLNLIRLRKEAKQYDLTLFLWRQLSWSQTQLKRAIYAYISVYIFLCIALKIIWHFVLRPPEISYFQASINV
jgi:hypothetical protein